MKNINFIFLRSIVTADENLINKNKDNYLKKLNKFNDFSYSKNGEKIFFIESGGTEGIFKSIYKRYKEPYILLAKDENNSLPAALEISTFLKKEGKKFKLIHGNIDEVREQIKNFKNSKIIRYNRKFLAHKILDKMNFGVIGKPSDWLIASDVNYKVAKQKFGANLIDISINEFLKNIDKKVDKKLVQKFVKKLPKKIDKKTLVGALQILGALKKLILKYNLSGLTIRCFDLLGTIKNTSCLALAILNSEGIIATCEGDIPTMLTMAIVKQKFNKSSFQVNPSYVNIKEKYAYFAHCTIPLDMTKSFSLDTHYESGIGIGVKGKLKNSYVTIFKLNSNLENFEVFEGKIVLNLHKNNLCRTQIKVKFSEDISEILSSPNGNHLVVFYGKFKNKIIK